MKRVLLLFTFSVLLFSCKKENENGGLFKGPEVHFFDGKVRSWIHLNNDGSPQQLGLSLDDAALNSLTTTGGSDHHDDNSVVVPLHPKAVAATPFYWHRLEPGRSSRPWL